MRLRILPAFLFSVAVAGTLMAADLPYAGKWKLNAAKSDFTGTTMAYSQLPSGEMEFSAEGQSYKFKIDGKDYPSMYGQTAAWKQIDHATWETVDKMDGKEVTRDMTRLSLDGNTMTVVSRGKKPGGESFEDTALYERVSGGPGLPGKWKATKVQVNSANLMELAANGSDGLTLTFIDYKASCKAKFDGKDYPATGPTMPQGYTMAVTKAGPRAFELIQKMNGKTLFTSSFTLSGDGKTLTETASITGTNEKIKAVFDRQ